MKVHGVTYEPQVKSREDFYSLIDDFLDEPENEDFFGRPDDPRRPWSKSHMPDYIAECINGHLMSWEVEPKQGIEASYYNKVAKANNFNNGFINLEALSQSKAELNSS